MTTVVGTDLGVLEAAFEAGHRLAAPAAALAFAAPEAFELPDLPAPAFSRDDQARMNAVAPLYLVAELDRALVLRGAEVLAGLHVTGALGPLGRGGGERLLQLWQRRNDRFTADERIGIFTRLFGASVPGPTLAVRGASNDAFEELLLDFTDAVSAMEPRSGWPSSAGRAALVASGTALASNLLGRQSGIPMVAADELISDASAAIEVFKAADVQAALHAVSPWSAVDAVARRYLRQEPAILAHVRRGVAGMRLLAWLSEATPAILGQGAPPTIPDTVTESATTWLGATLALHEAVPSAPGR